MRYFIPVCLVCLSVAALLLGCSSTQSNCRLEVAKTALEYRFQIEEECAEALPDIDAGNICLPGQTCPECPALEEAHKVVAEKSKACLSL